MKLLLLSLLAAFTLISGCSKNPRIPDEVSETQSQREVCLDWYGYKIDTGKAISNLDLKVETESELMAHCEFFKNVADTNKNPRIPDEVSETQSQREVCLDWYGYKVDTGKAISNLDLKVETESELMAYCEFFKNVADTK